MDAARAEGGGVEGEVEAARLVVHQQFVGLHLKIVGDILQMLVAQIAANATRAAAAVTQFEVLEIKAPVAHRDRAVRQMVGHARGENLRTYLAVLHTLEV